MKRSPQDTADTSTSVHQPCSVLMIDDDKHLFFWWFESRNDPVKDDVIMWLNGGPGCSSMTGLLMELGPCRINNHGNGTVNNPHSWTNNASIFFLDQPVGVGFSYGDKTVGTTRDASHDVYAFMKIWEEAFPKYKGNSFHIAGESYGGHYVPVFAKEIAQKGGFNLKSVMIGNGYFSEREYNPRQTKLIPDKQQRHGISYVPVQQALNPFSTRQSVRIWHPIYPVAIGC